MPIEYESPAPVAAAGSIYSDAAVAAQRQRNQQLAAEMYARAQAGGGQNQPGLDPVFQDAIFKRDQMRTVADAQSLDRTSVPNAQAFAAQTQATQQADHFRLQAELSQIQLSQQERMRLERLKNQLGAVASDPTLSDLEKQQFVTQLTANIDPLQHRLNQENVKSQAQMRQQQATDFQMKAALHKQQIDIANMDVDKRYHFQADPQALAEIAADLSQSLGPQKAEIPPAVFDKMVKDEAIRQGLGHHAYMQPDGKLMIQEKPGSASAGGKAGQFDHPTGLTPDQYLKALHEAERAVMEDSKAMKEHPTIPGTKVQAHPELATQEERDKAVAAIMKRRKLPGDFEEYTAMLKRMGGKAGYDPKRAPWAKKDEAATVATKPVTPPVTKTAIGDITFARDRIAASDGMTPDQKATAYSTLTRLQAIADAHPNGLPPDLAKEVEGLQTKYKDATAGMRMGKRPGATPAPGGTPDPAYWADQ